MKRSKQKPTKSEKGKVESEKKSSLPKQLIVLLASFIIISVLYNEVRGYKWVVQNLLLENMKVGKKYSETDIPERYQLKLGYNYSFIDYLIKNTPEDAIILIPPHDVIFPKDKKSNFSLKNPYLLARKPATSYFTYPRRLVFEDEKDSSLLYSQVTHVAIINGWGYEKLNYEVKNRAAMSVLPVNKSEQTTTSPNHK